MTTTNTPGFSGALPDPAATDGSTRWGPPVTDYAQGDGGATWGEVGSPAAVPPPVAEGPHTRPGWLTRGRAGDPSA